MRKYQFVLLLLLLCSHDHAHCIKPLLDAGADGLEAPRQAAGSRAPEGCTPCKTAPRSCTLLASAVKLNSVECTQVRYAAGSPQISSVCPPETRPSLTAEIM